MYKRQGLKDGDPFLDRLPWFKKAWLYDDVHKRLVKKSKDSQYFMEFMSKDEEEKLILFKDTSEFKDSPHMWCEIGESIIGVQPFVDGYNDAILITNEEGNIRVSNQNFYELSGLTHDVVINKSIFDLEKKNILPYCAIMDVIKTHQPKDSIAVSYTHLDVYKRQVILRMVSSLVPTKMASVISMVWVS